MKDIVGSHCSKVAERVRRAPIAESSKQILLEYLGRLPILYARFRTNSESRDGDQIARLLQNMLDQLAGDTPASEMRKLSSWIVERTQHLHEQSGIPTLKRLPGPAATAVKDRKRR